MCANLDKNSVLKGKNNSDIKLNQPVSFEEDENYREIYQGVNQEDIRNVPQSQDNAASLILYEEEGADPDLSEDEADLESGYSDATQEELNKAAQIVGEAKRCHERLDEIPLWDMDTAIDPTQSPTLVNSSDPSLLMGLEDDELLEVLDLQLLILSED